MVIQTEFFETNNIWKLQEQVNNFLKSLSYYNIIPQVHYNHMSSSLPRESDDDWSVLYTAMVVYDGVKITNDDSVPEPNDIMV